MLTSSKVSLLDGTVRAYAIGFVVQHNTMNASVSLHLHYFDLHENGKETIPLPRYKVVESLHEPITYVFRTAQVPHKENSLHIR